MNEKTAQESLQTWLQGLSIFADVDVTINDYSIFDGPAGEGPFAVIENSDDFNSSQDGYTPNDSWSIPVLLIVPFTFDKETLDNFRDYRQDIINEANDRTGNRTPVAGADVASIRSGTKVLHWYGDGVQETEPGTFPLYVFQQLIFDVRTF